ncbi:MAG: flagellar hook basal-body protein [Phycisphaerales bacterium]|nr:flagellar hook basal-body protein [Phycisphaerales bacterium]
MTYGLWLSTAGLQVNEYRQAVLANNLANADTVGFKHDLAVMQERPVESAAGGDARFGHRILDGMTGGTWVRPTVHTFERGEFEQTGNPMDVAIDGDGFLSVSDGDETRYTRDGRMTMNPGGELVLTAGEGRWRVLDDGGEPVIVDSTTGGAIEVSDDGTIRQGGAAIGKLGVVGFADRNQLSKVGGNLYRNAGPQPTAVAARVRSGHVERSTVNPVAGLAKMIEAARAYELNARMISLQDQTIGMAVTTVGRIG